MSERIRYRKVTETVQDSIKTFRHETNGAQYKIRLVYPSQEDNSHKWMILDAGTEVIAASGRHIQKNKAQLQVRDSLRKLGINIQTEKRQEYKKRSS